MRPRRKLPAYGRGVLEQRRKGLAPRGWLNVVRQWPEDLRPDSVGWFVVVPGADDPAAYDLSLCRGLPVFVVTSNQDRDNGLLVAAVSAAKPSIGCVICDREFTGWIEP